jgi:cellulose synthase/poly-beta-1,6-N-acetylglucosamine synthase-like glycosyltransferase
MTAPEPVRINQQISEFAWRVKNWVRPLGLFNLALPCQLMGTGMAFPWQIIHAADLANGSIVEDLKLGLDLAAAGQAPIFCSSARVLSQFASTKRGEDTQRQRWEQGHISTILRQAPRLFLRSLLTGNVNLLALTLDL